MGPIKPDYSFDKPTICLYQDWSDESFAPEIYQQNVPQIPKRQGKGWLSSFIITKGSWNFYLHEDYGNKLGTFGAGGHQRMQDAGMPNDQVSSVQIAEPNSSLPYASLYLFPTTTLAGLPEQWMGSTNSIFRVNKALSFLIFAGTWRFYPLPNFEGEPVDFGPGVYLGKDGSDTRRFLTVNGLGSIELL